MMALSLMSSDQILAHQSPTVRKFYQGNKWSTFRKNEKFPPNLGKTRISLKSVDRAIVGLVDPNNSLCWTLGFPVAGKHIS